MIGQVDDTMARRRAEKARLRAALAGDDETREDETREDETREDETRDGGTDQPANG
jgi:hypothetical protein